LVVEGAKVKEQGGGRENTARWRGRNMELLTVIEVAKISEERREEGRRENARRKQAEERRGEKREC
jgi:hypothetical protein